MLKPQQRQPTASRSRGFVASICNTASSAFCRRLLFGKAFLCFLRDKQLSGCRELLSFKPLAYEKVQQYIRLIVLHAHGSAHFKGLLLEPHSGH